jgi:hypothetical protein
MGAYDAAKWATEHIIQTNADTDTSAAASRTTRNMA